MRALTLIGDRKLELVDIAPPPPPGAGEVQVRVKAVALNHLDLWGFRGMAFAKRKLPLIVGAEAAGEIAVVGPDVSGFKIGDPVVSLALVQRFLATYGRLIARKPGISEIYALGTEAPAR